MSDNVFLTRAELARARGVDRRNKQFERLAPDAVLLMGSKKIPLFRNSPLPLPHPASPIQSEGINP